MSKLGTMSPDQQREIREIENKGSAPLEELARKNGRTTAAYLGKALLKHGLSKSRRAAAGRAELLAKWQHTDRLQNLAKLRRFWIRGGIRAG